MSETKEPVQVVQDLYSAFGRGDIAAILELLDENVDWCFVGRPEDIPFAGQRRGHEAMIDFFSTVARTCEVLEFGPQEVMTFEDKVLSLGNERVKVKANGRFFESDWIHLFTVLDGKVVRLREFYDTATLAAAFKNDEEGGEQNRFHDGRRPLYESEVGDNGG